MRRLRLSGLMMSDSLHHGALLFLSQKRFQLNYQSTLTGLRVFVFKSLILQLLSKDFYIPQEFISSSLTRLHFLPCHSSINRNIFRTRSLYVTLTRVCFRFASINPRTRVSIWVNSHPLFLIFQ